MKQDGVSRRRRLTSDTRKRITSYFGEAEQKEIASAAASSGVSQSSFIATAALKEARKVNSLTKSK
jgi:uncharacterized protein (DUF1778 family)